MRLNGQFGYVYKNAPTKTTAHELGHGIFKLEHPTASNTKLLMDYSESELLSHKDWQQIGDPAFKFYGFQDQSEGEFNGGYAITPNYKIFSVASSIITDEVDYTKEENKKYSDDGTLPGFKLNNKYYTWNYKENRYESKENSDTIIFKINPIDKSKLDGKKDIYLFFNKNNPCGKTTYKYIGANKYIESKVDLPSFIHENNDNRKDLPCIGTVSTNQDYGNNNWKFDPNNKSNDNNTEECNTTSFEYLSAPVENDVKAIKEAFIRGFNARKSIQSKEREQGKYNHIQYVNNSGKEGSIADIDKDDLELLEDKLHLLSYYKKDTYVGIVFLKRDYKQFYKADIVDKLALEVVKVSKAELGGKKALLIVVPYTYKVSKETDCLPVGFGQTTDNDVVRYSSVKIDTDKKWMSKVLGVYKEIPKPLYINRYYKMADGKIIQKSIKAENVTGRPFINALTFYESNGYDEIINFYKSWNGKGEVKDGKWYSWKELPLMRKQFIEEGEKIAYKYLNKEELEGSLENTELWKSIPTDDLGKFREIYMDEVKLTNKLWEKSVDKWAWGSKVEIALNEPKEDVQLLPKHFYNFDKMTLVDDVVYGVVDGIGLIPGVDTFTDPFGAVYAGIRGDYTNATIYSASFAIPLAGSAYIKGALKAGEDASQLVGIVAKKADNAEGYILEAKKISDIGANEVHVSSIYYGGDQKLTQKVLDGIKKEGQYIDGNYVRKSLAELSDNFATLLSKIDNLPNLSAAERNALKADINTSAELKNLFVKNIDKTDELSDAWKTVLNARGANSVLKKDVALINKVADLKKNNSFMQNIGGNDGLEKIIKNNVQAPCKSCGNSGSKYLKNMDEYLDDVEHFVTNFNNVSDAQRLITELKNGAQYTVEGGAFALRMFKENAGGLFTKGQVSAIDLRFSEDVLNRFDVKFANGFAEFKSYQIESISNVSINQLKQYLGAVDLSKIENLHYYFDKQKLLKEYGTGSFNNINEATNAVKEKFKTIFTNKSDEIFSSLNQNIKNELGLTGLNARSSFNDLISNTNSKLYNFIEIK
ncbi:hypothetical protein [Empedobacter stercoris]|uniref:hypothetical protein n=1 Tax=Empedobacter stercoris TaxID=1628248 RepID=UPI0039EAC461